MLNTSLLMDRISSANKTKKDCYELLGISKNTFDKILNLEKDFTTTQVNLICDFLEINSAKAKENIFLS